jgi:7-keto-8-aminopelargonate synthetase-like enzyme
VNHFREPLLNSIKPDRVVNLNGKPFLFFSGTAYLGMNVNPEFTRLMEEGMRIYGSNYGSSRSGNFTIPVYEEAETVMARHFKAEAALTVSSGFMAAQLVIRYFEDKAAFVYAPDCHPALFRKQADAITGDYHDWINELPGRLQELPGENIVILTNSIDPLKVKTYDFSWISRLPVNKKITVIIDDSHGLGILGKTGEGVSGILPEAPSVDIIIVSSLAKAMGMSGGVILAKSSQLSALRTSPFFTAASPMVPAFLYAYLHAEELYKKERTALFRNIHQLQQGLFSFTALRYIQDYPVIFSKDNQLAAKLFEQQILISSFSYPGPEDDKITRIIVSSCHTEEDIHFLISKLKYR